MVKVPTTNFDPAEFIRDDDDISTYLNDAFSSGDASIIAAAIGTVARARGASDIARATGISRGSLYSALSEGGNPTLRTILGVLDQLGIELAAKPKAA
ncbi:putative addiction module antidote protein [Novosphingobium umbonatum]|uniref:Putative addiction module antidote protein n=1 Tax=Novosphingobium umbonatum TaxID=1908524 RepID=A0A3S2V5C1_9SPHN|nr:addiction module antidote protein [Novosphingobium umbonatum]RVU03915.1 putative addiction module antidote protein [Novosphingobium umbonatum]